MPFPTSSRRLPVASNAQTFHRAALSHGFPWPPSRRALTQDDDTRAILAQGPSHRRSRSETRRDSGDHRTRHRNLATLTTQTVIAAQRQARRERNSEAEIDAITRELAAYDIADDPREYPDSFLSMGSSTSSSAQASSTSSSARPYHIFDRLFDDWTTLACIYSEVSPSEGDMRLMEHLKEIADRIESQREAMQRCMDWYAEPRGPGRPPRPTSRDTWMVIFSSLKESLRKWIDLIRRFIIRLYAELHMYRAHYILSDGFTQGYAWVSLEMAGKIGRETLDIHATLMERIQTCERLIQKWITEGRAVCARVCEVEAFGWEVYATLGQ